MKIIEKIIKIGFLAALALFLLAGLGKTVFRAKDINSYENRKANRLHAPTMETVLDASFQDSVEDALSDQVLLAETFKRLHNEGNSGYLYRAVKDFLRDHPEKYIVLNDIYVYGSDYLVYGPYDLSEKMEDLTVKTEVINTLMAEHPELDFYAFYVEKDSDIYFETGAKMGYAGFLQESLAMAPGHFGMFEINDFETYKDCFYHTDHHWNNRGSYRGYVRLAELLGVDEPLLEPVEELTLPNTLSGSKAASTGMRGVFHEPFPAYRFQFPEMDIQLNGEPAADYGRQEEFILGSASGISYGTFYGGDTGEAVFDTGRADRKNILVLGDSYDNAVLKLLASHFHKTYSIDVRNYEHAMGRPFAFGEYVKENNIDQVLFVGCGTFFTIPELLQEG